MFILSWFLFEEKSLKRMKYTILKSWKEKKERDFYDFLMEHNGKRGQTYQQWDCNPFCRLGNSISSEMYPWEDVNMCHSIVKWFSNLVTFPLFSLPKAHHLINKYTHNIDLQNYHFTRWTAWMKNLNILSWFVFFLPFQLHQDNNKSHQQHFKEKQSHFSSIYP